MRRIALACCLVFSVFAAVFAQIGCGRVDGLNEVPTPLARLHIQISGDLQPLRPIGTEGETPRLKVALVWGAQRLPEVFCVSPNQTVSSTGVVEAGCPDNFGFTPKQVAANGDVQSDGSATIDLFSVPTADVMVGDVTSRIAYGSVVVYDDRDGSGTLELRRSQSDLSDPPDGGVFLSGSDSNRDFVYGASFISMTKPDVRVGYREGNFNANSAFFPRRMCGAPPLGFSLLSAGGFSEEAAKISLLTGQIPSQDPTTCAQQTLDQKVIQIQLQAPGAVQHLACTPRRTSGLPRYREARSEPPDMADRVWACSLLPNSTQGVQELVIAGPPDNACKSLTHYLLRGCSSSPTCQNPEWDHSADPPSWWPCTRAP